MVDTKIQLDFTEEGLRTNVKAVQGDTGRTLLCNIAGADMTGVSARFYAVKKSGKEIYNNCKISGNSVMIELTEQTLAEVGIVDCQLDLRKSGQKVQSFIFTIEVTPSLMAQSETISSNEFKVVEDIADDVAENKNKIAELENKKADKDQFGAPLISTKISEMKDKTRVYVYTGTEEEYIAGNWYYWDGSAWISGGIYNSAAVETDETLSVAGKAADSAIVGQQIGELNESLGNVNEEISDLKGVGSGLTTEQKRYIISLFKSAVYSENMSDMVTALENSFNTIPATGIKLSPTTLKFSGIGDTQKITATLTPDTATSSILWESDNTDVVTVKDGVATAVNDGIATITATSGSATAKCSVNVNTKELYSISNKVCNADFYEATGLKLGSDSANGYSKSWTLLANFSTTASAIVYGLNTSAQGCDFRTGGANNPQLMWCSNRYDAKRSTNNNWCYALTHEANSNNITTYEYINDELKKTVTAPGYSKPNASEYTGEICVGGKTSAAYVGTIYDLSIVMRKLTDDEILQFLKEGVY